MRRTALLAIAFLIVITASVSLYLTHRNEDYAAQFGAAGSPDRVSIQVWLNRLDTGTERLHAEIVVVEPTGKLANDDGTPRSSLEVTTSALRNPKFTIGAGSIAPDTPVDFAVNGTVTDYPFDHYSSKIYFSAKADGRPVPVSVLVSSADPFFRNIPQAIAAPGQPEHLVMIGLESSRSRPTLVFAIFVMLLMLGLSIAVVTASNYVLRYQKALIFPACSMMAAILFALIPLRGALPGDPPIGSIIDFTSFFIAETVVAVALIASVVLGFRMEVRRSEVEADPDGIEPESPPPAS
ncbi:hypothetical protein GOHSU_29_00540 [Gordonia hirsuta DSM 44140 = NBRC 16056]|uniref:DUF4436 domain-containing protein n=1 Tax=Gordonia hirsuta DSM 44140 = NBRC 16056 TaxID=1121927 RepID=L7LBG5_9ACTN|nr:DUF4436 family protein [Gordonia hirsuta]GAC58071.1 hypothetical protein GOHSU_29_00540 [Gordonia hirsuta DSM 44140 = NBRC 16056]